MFLVTTAVFPPDKSQKIAEKYIEVAAKELPPFLKRLHALVNSKTEEGIKVLSIFEVDDANIKDGIIEITKRCVQFNAIQGFRFEIETMMPRQFKH
jgi:polyphosphate kinase 2 (PPK2 family)